MEQERSGTMVTHVLFSTNSLLSLFVSHKKTPLTILTSGACCVVFLGMDRFKFGDTMVTDWVYLRGHGGSGESSNFF